MNLSSVKKTFIQQLPAWALIFAGAIAYIFYSEYFRMLTRVTNKYHKIGDLTAVLSADTASVSFLVAIVTFIAVGLQIAIASWQLGLANDQLDLARKEITLVEADLKVSRDLFDATTRKANLWLELGDSIDKQHPQTMTYGFYLNRIPLQDIMVNLILINTGKSITPVLVNFYVDSRVVKQVLTFEKSPQCGPNIGGISSEHYFSEITHMVYENHQNRVCYGVQLRLNSATDFTLWYTLVTTDGIFPPKGYGQLHFRGTSQ